MKQRKKKQYKLLSRHDQHIVFTFLKGLLHLLQS